MEYNRRIDLLINLDVKTYSGTNDNDNDLNFIFHFPKFLKVIFMLWNEMETTLRLSDTG